MATNRTNIGSKFQNTDIPSEADFKEIFDSFVHKDEDKADFQMVETGTDTEHYVTPALLRTGLQNIGIITGNSFMPYKEYFEDSFTGTILPLSKFPIPNSVKVFKNGQLLQEGPDYTINFDTAVITFSDPVSDRNLEVDYWYKNLSPNPGSGSGSAIDFTSFLHTSGNETKNGLLTFNNTTATSTSGVILKNSGSAATSLDVTNSGAGNGISLQNSATGTGVKVSNAGSGVAVNVNSEPGSTGDILQVSKNNVVKAKIDNEGNVTAEKFVTSGGTAEKFVKGDGSLDPKVYAEDTKVIHTEGNESKDGALTLTHDASAQDVLTITKNNSANCLKLVQNSSSNATTSTIDTNTANVNRKAISIQKVQQEKAFITHDGNVTATSFTTLSQKADITDGLLTLANSTPPAASQGQAKLYAKTDGTTDMYVMGSDGIEKKIGANGDLDNVLHKTGFATETKTGELVIDSGINDISGLVLKKISQETAVINGGVLYSSGYNKPYNMVVLSTQEVLVVNYGGNNVLKIPADGGMPSIYCSDILNPIGIALLPNGEVLVGSTGIGTGTNAVYKIPVGGGVAEVYATGLSGINAMSVFPNGEVLVGTTNSNGVYKIPAGGGTPEIYSTQSATVRDIVLLPNGDSLIACQSSTVYKIPAGGGPGTIYATVPVNSISLCLLPNGEVLVGAPYSSQIHKIPVGGGTSIFYASISNFYSYMTLKNDGTVLISSLNNNDIRKLNTLSSKILKTDPSGLVIKTEYLEDVPYLKSSDIDLSPYAKLASPIFSGAPAAPTAPVGTNTTQIATTAFVTTADVNNVKTSGNQVITGQKSFSNSSTGTTTVLQVVNNSANTNGSAAYFLSSSISNSNLLYLDLQSAVGGKGILIDSRISESLITPFTIRNLGSDVLTIDKTGGIVAKSFTGNAFLTGVPTAPTATVGTNTTQIATTAFVKANSGISIAHLKFDNTDNTVWNNGKNNYLSSTSFGERALRSNTLGNLNTAIGTDALASNTTGNANTAIGANALRNIFSSDNNIALGYHAGEHLADGGTELTSADSSIFLGTGTRAAAQGQTNQIVIGTYISGQGSNTVTIGGADIISNYFKGVINTDSYKIYSLNTPPSSATATGNLGEIRYTSTHIYLCIATNTWVRTALTSW